MKYCKIELFHNPWDKKTSIHEVSVLVLYVQPKNIEFTPRELLPLVMDMDYNATPLPARISKKDRIVLLTRFGKHVIVFLEIFEQLNGKL